ncbi:MAG: complex I NDUFA9 subunit family protein [Gammaproteobacteria bacterium]|nr:complex I NDUFA9 subunit family protein [Gammaproteobacteria bacterium]
MPILHRNVILLGGSGFIGKQLAFTLANRGCQVTVPCRRPHRHRSLLVHPGIRVVEANVLDSEQLQQLCRDNDAVINLVGILHEHKKGDFRTVHVNFVKSLVSACTNNNIKRLLHLSALGADQARASSLYLRSKGEGENLLHTFGQKDLEVTSFQPSVVFGKHDKFINRFASILNLCIGFFPLACPHSKIAPVYVGDLVERMVNTLDDRSSHSKRYTVCGPEVFTLQQIVELIIGAVNSRCRVLPLGNALSKFQAAILQNLPGKLFTLDNYRSLQTDNICADTEPCPTNLRQYIQDLCVLFSNKKHYDDFRQHCADNRNTSFSQEP